ncbi:MAG: hypothetical protein FWD18_09045 [Micrococcales bacterium]|nr:hypothetical protein [Micrococcales bacterium]
MRRRGWDAYFLDPAAFEELPPQALSISSADLLLVVDYVAFSTERLGRWLGALPATPRGRLRVIFVERDGWTAPTIDPAVAAPDWFGRLSDAWDAQDLARHFGAVQGLAPVVTLADRSMDATVLTQIVEGVDIARVRRYEADAYPLAPPRPALEGPVPSSVATTIVERLQTVIDPSAQRPLYLLFLVQAYLNDPADDRWRTWDVRDLYGVIYNRERRRVLETVPHGFADVALDVWAFATATRTRLSDALQDAPSWLVATVTDQPNIVQESFRRALRACCGSSDCDAVPYVPDIPGEHLVTRQLSGWRDLDRVRQFAVAAWERSAEGYSAFCSRAVVDLAATRSDPHSVLNPEGLLVEPRKKNDVQALAHALSTAVDPDHPRPDITDWLVTLATRHQDDAEMTRLAIRAVVASASNPAEMGMNSDGNPDFVATLRLAMPPIDKYECRLLQRVLESWAGNVLTLRMKNEELDEFGEIINHRDNLSTLGRSLSQAEIRAQQWVAEHRPNYADVVSECVIALTTASLAVGSAMPWLTVSTVCDHLEAEGISWSPLLSDRSTRPLLRAFALLSATYETLDVTQRRTLADQLRALAYQHSADSDVAIQIAEGFFNLTIKAELEENRNLVNELRQLTTRNPDTPEIARQLAMGLVNLTWKRETDLEETRSLVDELRQLTSPHLDNLQMASQLAMGLVNLTIKAELEETRSLVNELRQLTTRHPDTPEIAVRLSKGLFNLTIETMNDTEETRTLLQELDHLWTQLRVDDHLVTVIDSLEEFMDDRGGVALEGANSVARDVLEQGAITTKVLTELSRRWVKKYGSVPEDPR